MPKSAVSDIFFNRAIHNIITNKNFDKPFTRKGASPNQNIEIRFTGEGFTVKYGKQSKSVSTDLVQKLLNADQSKKNDIYKLKQLLKTEIGRLVAAHEKFKDPINKTQRPLGQRFRVGKKTLHKAEPSTIYDIVLYILREVAPKFPNLKRISNPLKLNKKYISPHVAKNILEEIDDELCIFSEPHNQANTWIPDYVHHKLGLDGKDQILIGDIVNLLHEKYSSKFPKLS